MAAKPPRWIYWLAAAVWVIVSGPVGYFVGHGTSSSPAQFEQPVTAVAPQSAFPGTRLTWVGSGTFQVPAQAAPGQYIVTASGLTFGCSWIRLSADNDKPKSVIDSGSVNRGGFDRFTVGAGDRVLRLIGDCTWARS